MHINIYMERKDFYFGLMMICSVNNNCFLGYVKEL